MIKSFKDPYAQTIWRGKVARRLPPDIQNTARRKLRQLDAAAGLQDLRIPPNNKLEALSGNRAGQHSIRINDQWRICFVWRGTDAFDVEIVDYH